MIKASLLILAFMSMGVSSCGRSSDDLFKKVDADIWLHDAISAEVCSLSPEETALCQSNPLTESMCKKLQAIHEFGLYRKVACTDAARVAGLCGPNDKTYEEFIQYCNKAIEDHVAMTSGNFKKWIDAARERIDKCL